MHIRVLPLRCQSFTTLTISRCSFLRDAWGHVDWMSRLSGVGRHWSFSCSACRRVCQTVSLFHMRSKEVWVGGSLLVRDVFLLRKCSVRVEFFRTSKSRAEIVDCPSHNRGLFIPGPPGLVGGGYSRPSSYESSILRLSSDQQWVGSCSIVNL